MPMWLQLSLQDSNSPIMENMILFHDYTMITIIFIVMMIIYMLFFMFLNKKTNRNMFEGQMIEIIWTILPMGFLFIIAIPSLKLLYLTDEINNSLMTMKCIGHQWYWSYEYNDLMINFDSFMLDKNNLNKSMYRLLEVDNNMILPEMYNIRFLITSIDVIHSFTIPSSGLKIDAIPGRINQINSYFNRPGLYYGQCSEICGVNHSFMPIVIEITKINNFINWLKFFN